MPNAAAVAAVLGADVTSEWSREQLEEVSVGMECASQWTVLF
jgi:hypothetical protein